jgi:hypothetical protein
VSRYQCFGRKVATKFGNLYAHVDADANGRVVGMKISYPGKFEDTEIGEAMDELSQATRDIIREDINA